ncbi:uncharacterized protein KY384_006883 [Bacidia gigantensis]|uniref:uncharacterized protein n=1 Tax=Bacidia gigantensis TaxID=2732470 RepID=UPI001D052A1D|nr:uncharacterized protein KY384_006883 [Bacidia gigantensis]KAG8527967.1 hypothetical protein KY384_006883 [Bacidia gigantensis]
MSRSGIKRKQPPGESPDEAQLRLMQQAASAEQYANAPHHLSAQATGQFTPHQGSISSQSSGFRHDSYASSAGPSVGDGSYTSIEQSPGGVSPNSDTQHYQLNNQDSQYSTIQMSAQNARSGPYPQQPSDNRSTPTQKSQDSSRKQSANLQAPYQCECCLKKPKKFQTLEELNQHQGEKQYSCLYCKNKFKNKNEAERHQNSIHRRDSSWSCAALADDFVTAFFPNNAPPSGTSPIQQQAPQTSNGVAACDICGYCGEEFTNEPQPDWEKRHQHLITQHKFGDCNRSKKFYRADHFRQHLKHSHGGKSGKHTNALEQACLRNEAPQLSSDNSQSNTPPQPPGGAPIAHMGSLATPMGHHGISQHDLNQAQLQQQMNVPPGSMGPPQMVPQFDASKIDPSIGYMTAPHHHQQHALHIQGAGSGGYGMSNESS